MASKKKRTQTTDHDQVKLSPTGTPVKLQPSPRCDKAVKSPK